MGDSQVRSGVAATPSFGTPWKHSLAAFDVDVAYFTADFTTALRTQR
ncbi:hypothetical protein [Gordonia sp. CPCC 205333]